jgi:hypothetical protein
MNKSLLIVGIALGIGTTACTSTGHAVRGSTTAHAGNTGRVASSPPPSSYRDFPLGIASSQTRATNADPASWVSTAPSYRDFPLFIESSQSSTASVPARWYRLAPQHALMSDGTGQQTAMLPR